MDQVIVKNINAVDLSYAGIIIPATSSIEIEDKSLINYLAYYTQFIEAIKNGDIVINDGTEDLGIWPAIFYIREQTRPCLEITLCDNTHPYLNVVHLSYTKKACFLFSGSDSVGEPSAIEIYATWVGSGGHYGQVRISNISHIDVPVIAEKQFVGVASPYQPLDMGPLANIPESDSVLEIDCLTSSVDAQFKIFCLGIRW